MVTASNLKLVIVMISINRGLSTCNGQGNNFQPLGKIRHRRLEVISTENTTGGRTGGV